MDVTKTCIKCGRELPISDFYKMTHSKDGYDGRCKQCVNRIHLERYHEKMKDDAYVEAERIRGREKFKRLGYNNKKTLKTATKHALYPTILRTKKRLKISCPRDIEVHHWNYNLADSVILIPRTLHHRLHAEITLDVCKGFYYQGDNPLDTVEKHLEVLRSVCAESGYDFSIVDTTYI